MHSRATPSHVSAFVLTLALTACTAETPAPAAGGNEAQPAAGQQQPSDPIATMDEFIAKQKIDKSGTDWKTRLPKPPKLTFDDKTYIWHLDTNMGPIDIELMPKVAPMHVSSTIYLTRLGFYDGLTFHRVIPTFMAQGGDPTGTGSGGPGYRYEGEFDPDVRHDHGGLLSMAHAGPGTDGSQFFITFKDTHHLDGLHTIFGKVVQGMETVKALEEAGTPSGATLHPLKIEKASVRAE